jgi:hypothetical protein
MATTSMIVTGIRIQSATKYDLLKNPATGFKMITVTRDADGFAPPPLGGATGNKDVSLADIIASHSVWSDLNVAIRRFPFTAIITHDSAGNVSDLAFDTALVTSALRDSGDTRAIRRMLESVLVRGEVEWVVRARGVQHRVHNGRDSETLGLEPTGTDIFPELE